MFRGSFLHTIDSKGRINIPARFREILIEKHEGRLILTKGLVDKCIIAYTPKAWEELEAKIQKAPSMNENVKAFSLHIFSSAEDCYIDNQGRILISPRLRDYASITRDALVIGVISNIKIWNPDVLEQVLSASDPKAIERGISEFGI